MKLNTLPECRPVNSPMQSRILALLTALAPISCAAAVQDKPAVISAEQERELIVAEFLEAIDVPREGIQPDGKSYVLCRQTKGEMRAPFKMTLDALEYLFRALGRSKDSLILMRWTRSPYQRMTGIVLGLL